MTVVWTLLLCSSVFFPLQNLWRVIQSPAELILANKPDMASAGPPPGALGLAAYAHMAEIPPPPQNNKKLSKPRAVLKKRRKSLSAAHVVAEDNKPVINSITSSFKVLRPKSDFSGINPIQ